MSEFKPFPKISRISRQAIVTEKLDGTNASVFIGEDGEFLTGSRTRWITPEDDNYGFSKWANANREELLQLGPGMHFGEWWGQGIQRKYNLTEKRWSLFNVSKWEINRPTCCHVVPVLWAGIFTDLNLSGLMENLKATGSVAAPGFMKPEGLVIFHTAGGQLFKKTIEKDEEPKGRPQGPTEGKAG